MVLFKKNIFFCSWKFDQSFISLKTLNFFCYFQLVRTVCDAMAEWEWRGVDRFLAQRLRKRQERQGKTLVDRGSGGRGHVVSVLAFYSDDPSSNSNKDYTFSVKVYMKRMKINKKRGRVGQFLISSMWERSKRERIGLDCFNMLVYTSKQLLIGAKRSQFLRQAKYLNGHQMDHILYSLVNIHRSLKDDKAGKWTGNS